MKSVRLLLTAALLLALTACAAADDSAAQFGIWAASEEFVASVASDPVSDDSGAVGINAHLVIDGAITHEKLTALASAAMATAEQLGITEPKINFIVGNAWGFSVDKSGTNVAVINALRDAPAFVGGTLDYQPLDGTLGNTTGIRAILGSQAALREAYDIVLTAVVNAGGSVDAMSISATTADGAFVIDGIGDRQPIAAIALWQAISARVPISAATATRTSSNAESLHITVGSSDDRTAAEAIAADFSDVALTVTTTG